MLLSFVAHLRVIMIYFLSFIVHGSLRKAMGQKAGHSYPVTFVLTLSNARAAVEFGPPGGLVIACRIESNRGSDQTLSLC